MEVNFPPGCAKRGRQLLGARRRIEPIRTERDEQGSRGHVAERVREPAAPVLPGEVEVGKSPGGVKICVGIAAPHGGIRAVTQATLELELGLEELAANN